MGGGSAVATVSGWLGSLIAPIESTALTVIEYSLPAERFVSVRSVLAPWPTGMSLRNTR